MASCHSLNYSRNYCTYSHVRVARAYLSGKVPCQELNWIQDHLRSSQSDSLGFRIAPLLYVDSSGSLWVFDGLVGKGSKSTQQRGLTPFPVADEEQLDSTIAHRPGGRVCAFAYMYVCFRKMQCTVDQEIFAVNKVCRSCLRWRKLIRTHCQLGKWQKLNARTFLTQK